jgi:hypothetical protein
VIVAQLTDGKLGVIDPATGSRNEDYFGPGGSFEIDIVVLPDGFDDDLGRFGGGDLLVANFGRGFIPDFDGGGIKTNENLFNDSDQLFEYVSLYVPPTNVFGPMVLGVYTGFDGMTIRQITPEGEQLPLFDLVSGVSASAAMSLSIYQGDVEYLILGNFSSAAASLPTGQIREEEAGLELMVYNPSRATLQVVGVFSEAAGSDMTFTQSLNQTFFSLPAARKVIQLQGLAAE